jgi:hypothetical protein
MITQRRHTSLASINISRFLVLALLLLSLGEIAAADETSDSLKAERLTFPVTLSDGSAAQVVGYLYYKGSAIAGIFDTSVTRVGATTGSVLVQLGEFDALFPASLADGEAAYFTSASSVTVQLLAGVGHDFNTHFPQSRGLAAD